MEGPHDKQKAHLSPIREGVARMGCVLSGQDRTIRNPSGLEGRPKPKFRPDGVLLRSEDPGTAAVSCLIEARHCDRFIMPERW